MSSETATSASSSSPERAPARCSHFGTCGGCASQDLPYPEQLARKAARVEAALASAGPHPAVGVRGSPDIWFYRNKMEFSFGDVYPPPSSPPSSGWSGLRLGLKPKGRWYDVLDLAECFLLSPETPALLAAVRAWAAEHGLLPYNSHKHNGLLRHLVLREAKNGPGRMITLVTAPGSLPGEAFVKAVAGVYPATTILRGINGKLSDTAVSDSMELLTGEGHIVETLRFGARELRFRISPQSFFQTNTRGAEVLYSILRDWMSQARPDLALDLYCGGGAIALCVADHCGRVIGAEQNPSAVADARANAASNRVLNADFHGGSVESLLPGWQDLQPQVAIVDPPRAGLNSKALKSLWEMSPAAIFYISCNPEALGRDLEALAGCYSIERVEAVDLFPHTEHVETAVWLKKT